MEMMHNIATKYNIYNDAIESLMIGHKKFIVRDLIGKNYNLVDNNKNLTIGLYSKNSLFRMVLTNTTLLFNNKHVYDCIEKIFKFDEKLMYISMIIADNLNSYRSLMYHTQRTVTVVSKTFIQGKSFFYCNEYDNVILMSINLYDNLKMNLIINNVDAMNITDDDAEYLFEKLIDVYNLYNNYEIFNNVLWVYDPDENTFESSHSSIIIYLDTNEIIYMSNHKLLSWDFISENNIELWNFINNCLSFENIIFINVFINEKSNDIIISCKRYRINIVYSNNKFYFNSQEIITNYKNRYDLYRWIYGTQNIIMVKSIDKNINKYKLIIFNTIINNKNNKATYSKNNEFWCESRLESKKFNISIGNKFNFYIVELSQNLLSLDITLSNIDALIVLCYSYIFFNKINESINLIYLLSNEYKNKNDNNLLDFLKIFMTNNFLNTPFNHLIQGNLNLNGEHKLSLQQIYFCDYFRIPALTNDNIIILEPINKFRFEIKTKNYFIFENIGKSLNTTIFNDDLDVIMTKYFLNELYGDNQYNGQHIRNIFITKLFSNYTEKYKKEITISENEHLKFKQIKEQKMNKYLDFAFKNAIISSKPYLNVTGSSKN